MKSRNDWFGLMLAGTFVLAGCSNNDYGDDPTPPQPMNAAPVVASIANVNADQDTVVGPVEFAVNDDNTPANMLMVTAAVDGTSPFPADAVVTGGSGATRSITLTPLEAATGTANVTVTVSDAQGLVTTRGFTVTVNSRPASVRDAVMSTFTKAEADAATTLNGYTFAQDADDPETFTGLLGAQ